MSVTDFTGLSQRYAEAGDLRMAQLAAWAADVHTLEELLWENGLGHAPDPGAQLASIGDSVAASVEELARTLPDGPVTARALLDAAREAMVTTFDESVHGLLSDRLGDLEHLDHVEPRDPATGRTAERLDGRTPAELAAELRTAAADCATMATLLGVGGEDQAAARLGRQADAAAFEAYLVLAALRSGDHTLATVDLRWDLVAEQAGRERFASAVGSAEHAALHLVLEPVETP
ncbi:hypothetical protein [Nocardioides aquiterrae]|uniref:DUF222 domain-containing protein n=1 Tax=Nocardioides aquiterrae TaxID=203799 RepID=A0ABP4F524_9ACTN